MGFKLGSARRGSSSRLNAQANIALIISAAFLNTSPYSADYLIVGGGGGGGSGGASFAAGGGGAGGFISGAATLTYANTYIITIGGGGTTIGANTLSVGYTEVTAKGSNTTLFGNNISFIAQGGGHGATATWTFPPSVAPATVNNSWGGNAATGGGALWSPAGAAGRAIGSPALNVVGTQGWPGGGAGVGGGGSNGGAGGGGGAGSEGGTSPPSATAPGAAGGLGNVWALTGPTIRYAGGGAGGGSRFAANVVAFGGNVSPSTPLLKGGGGDGGAGLGNFFGTNGTNNTGGGGGGAMGSDPPNAVNRYSGGSGGSGLVKIAMPSLVYPSVSYTGSVTVEQSATSPEKTIITFNSSGTLTA